MVWGGICLAARTELVPIENGSLTAHRYVTDILEPYVMTFAPFIGQDFILMHDNARPHTARIVSNYLDEVGITQMKWPARSPDMNVSSVQRKSVKYGNKQLGKSSACRYEKVRRVKAMWRLSGTERDQQAGSISDTAHSRLHTRICTR